MLESAKYLLKKVLFEANELHAKVVKIGNVDEIESSKNGLNELMIQGKSCLERKIEKNPMSSIVKKFTTQSLGNVNFTKKPEFCKPKLRL